MLAAFLLLSVAALLGAVLLMPALPRARRALTASAHGIIGAAGAALVAVPVLTRTGPSGLQASATPAGFLGLGLIAGVTLYAITRHRRAPPPLVLTLHILFAGLGFLLVAGHVLG